MEVLQKCDSPASSASSLKHDVTLPRLLDESGKGFGMQVNPEMRELLLRRHGTAQLREHWYNTREIMKGPTAATLSEEIGQRPRRFLHLCRRSDNYYLEDGRFNTGFTQRAAKDSTQNYDALTRTMVSCPTWNCKQRPPSSSYVRHSIEDWQREIIKDNPERGPISISVHVSTPKKSETKDGDSDWLQTQRTMFKPVRQAGNKKQLRQLEYLVDPEWVSENTAISKYRAHQYMMRKS